MKSEFSKVAAVTLGFWIIKIIATTLGEVGGDAVTMSMQLGYLAGSLIFAAIFVVAVLAQIAAKKFHPFLFWFVIVATTTFGTTLADFFDRSLGIGYAGGAAVLLTGVLGALAVWRWTLGTVSVASVSGPKAESFYWLTITLSQTLGTALGDWAADGGWLGYAGGAALFGGLLALLVLAWWRTGISRVVLFWAAFILTRPLGATVGDFLDKPVSEGGLALSRYSASTALMVFIVASILIFRQSAAKKTVN